MRTWVNVARYHLVRPVMYLGMPWAFMVFCFGANLAIFRYIPMHDTAHRDTGAVVVIYVFYFIRGIFSTGQSLPFGLALGVSRRSYYTGTALLAVFLAAADALVLTGLQAIERTTGGWGEAMHFFRVPYILNGPWYLTWLTSFVALTLLYVYGMWFGIVYRRWGLAGSLLFITAQMTVMLAVALLITWTGTGHDLVRLSAAGVTGLLAAVAALLVTGGYATVRRAAV
jgi:hypothetical protein